jgi:hypothetical protein
MQNSVLGTANEAMQGQLDPNVGPAQMEQPDGMLHNLFSYSVHLFKTFLNFLNEIFLSQYFRD